MTRAVFAGYFKGDNSSTGSRVLRRPERCAVALGRPDGVQGCTTTAHKCRYYSRDLSRESEKGLLLFLIGGSSPLRQGYKFPEEASAFTKISTSCAKILWISRRPQQVSQN
jgi:hypothetical protein